MAKIRKGNGPIIERERALSEKELSDLLDTIYHYEVFSLPSVRETNRVFTIVPWQNVYGLGHDVLEYYEVKTGKKFTIMRPLDDSLTVAEVRAKFINLGARMFKDQY